MEGIMELKNTTNALLDKVVIYNFTVINIFRIEKLIDTGIVIRKEFSPKITKDQERYLMTENGDFYNSIKISKTEFFDSFNYSKGNNKHIFAELQLSVSDGLFHNLNCLTAAEYLERLNDVQNFLEKEYGIIADFSLAKYKYVEINKTLILNDSFILYERPIILMMHLLPGTLRLKNDLDCTPNKHKNKNKAEINHHIQTFSKSSGKRGITLIIYDKSDQLITEYMIEISHNFLRYEIKLNSADKIISILGTNFVHQISDQSINEYFSSFIQKNVIRPYARESISRAAKVKHLLRTCYKKGSRTWVRSVLSHIANAELSNRGIPIILDIEEILPLLDDIKFANRQAKHRAKKMFINISCREYSVFAKRDDVRYLELMEKLK